MNKSMSGVLGAGDIFREWKSRGYCNNYMADASCSMHHE